MLALCQIKSKYSSRACFHTKVTKLYLQGENMAKLLGTYSVPGCLAGLQAESRVNSNYISESTEGNCPRGKLPEMQKKT